VLEKFVQIRSN